MHDPPRTRAYLHPIPRRNPPPRVALHHTALSVYFLYGPIGNLIMACASGCQPGRNPSRGFYLIIVSRAEFRRAKRFVFCPQTRCRM